MSAIKSRFPKSARLHLKREIDDLFESGSVIKMFPIHAVFKMIPGAGGLKVAVSVPKKRIRLATDRNRIKRQMREAYRLNCHDSITYFKDQHLAVNLILIYTGKVSPDYAALESKIILILQRLAEIHEMGTD